MSALMESMQTVFSTIPGYNLPTAVIVVLLLNILGHMALRAME